jgi:hypothetical protein
MEHWLENPRIKFIIPKDSFKVIPPFIACPTALKLAPKENYHLRDLIELEINVSYANKFVVDRIKNEINLI